jgi:hypothetical protein
VKTEKSLNSKQHAGKDGRAIACIAFDLFGGSFGAAAIISIISGLKAQLLNPIVCYHCTLSGRETGGKDLFSSPTSAWYS